MNEDDPADTEEKQSVAESVPQAEEEENIEDVREAMSEDEIASLMANADEIAAEAERTATTSAKPEESKAEEGGKETVEVGFTALQAGKEVDDDVSEVLSSSEPEEQEEQAVEKRELVTVSFEIDEDAVEKVPSHLAIAALAVPVKVTEEGVVCKVATPIDRASIDLIEDAVAMKVVLEPAPMEEVLHALRSAYGSESLWKEREAVMGVAPNRYKSKKRKKNFFGSAA